MSKFHLMSKKIQLWKHFKNSQFEFFVPKLTFLAGKITNVLIFVHKLVKNRHFQFEFFVPKLTFFSGEKITNILIFVHKLVKTQKSTYSICAILIFGGKIQIFHYLRESQLHWILARKFKLVLSNYNFWTKVGLLT